MCSYPLPAPLVIYAVLVLMGVDHAKLLVPFLLLQALAIVVYCIDLDARLKDKDPPWSRWHL